MLFSNPKLASVMNSKFECAWQERHCVSSWVCPHSGQVAHVSKVFHAWLQVLQNQSELCSGSHEHFGQ